MQPEHSHLSQLGLIRTWSKIWRFEAAPLSSPAIWSMVCRMSRVGNSFNVFNQKAMSACKANMGSPVVSCMCSQVHFEGNQKRKRSFLRFPQENKRGMPQAGSVASLLGGRSLGGRPCSAAAASSPPGSPLASPRRVGSPPLQRTWVLGISQSPKRLDFGLPFGLLICEVSSAGAAYVKRHCAACHTKHVGAVRIRYVQVLGLQVNQPLEMNQ